MAWAQPYKRVLKTLKFGLLETECSNASTPTSPALHIHMTAYKYRSSCIVHIEILTSSKPEAQNTSTPTSPALHIHKTTYKYRSSCIVHFDFSEKNSREKNSEAYNTCCSQAVTHPSTGQALRCLTTVIRREPVFSAWYGRRHQNTLTAGIYTRRGYAPSDSKRDVRPR